MTVSQAKIDCPPLVIRGESPSNVSGEISIDTLSITLPRQKFEEFSGYADSSPFWDHPHEDNKHIYQTFIDSIFGINVIELDEVRGGRNYFRHSITFKNKAGFIAFGGNNACLDVGGDVLKYLDEKIQIYLPGEGCALIRNWSFARKQLEKYQASITRIDIAYDDHQGYSDINSVREAYAQQQFQTSGRPPKAQYIDDCGSGDGKTFYVGNRENGKYFRAYEKGKQLGDIESKWIRLEVEFKAKDRHIPLDILTSAKFYIAGSYPALSFISFIQEVIKTVKEKLKITFNHLNKHCRIQYGRLICYSLHHLKLTPEQVIKNIYNSSGYPSRLIIQT